MDWRAVEENEKELQDGIAEAIADGGEDAIGWAVAAELQLSFMRPWLTFIAKHRMDGKRTTNAIILNVASMLAETVENTVWTSRAGEVRDHNETLLWLLKRVGEEAARLLEQAKAGGDDTGVKFGVPIDLGGQSDG